MAGRKQKLFLLFLENETYNVIHSRLVRLYMNRFTINEEEETEIEGVYDIKNNARDEYEQCISRCLEVMRDNEQQRTDTHFILGNSLINEWKTYDSRLRKNSLIAQILSFIASHRSSMFNCCACTILHGSHSLAFDSERQYQKEYNYDEHEKIYKESMARYDYKSGPSPDVIYRNIFRKSINDDLESLHSRILDFGINHRHLRDEVIHTFFYKILDDDEIDELKISIRKYNENLSFFKRLFASHSFPKIESNQKYLRFACKRHTYFF